MTKKFRALANIVIGVAALCAPLMTAPSAFAYPTTVSVHTYSGADAGYTGGTVTGSGFTCGTGGTTCSQQIEMGTSVTLTASSNSGRVFDTWNSPACTAEGGGSSSGNTCTIVAGANTTGSYADPRWRFTSYTVNVTKTGDGSGTVTGTGTYNDGTTATLQATASTGSVFAGWQTSGDICASSGKGGGGAVTNPTCTKTMTSWNTNTFTAVAKFDKASSSAPTSTNTTNNTSTSTPTQTTSAPTASPVTDTKINGETADDQTAPVIHEPSITLTGKATPGATVVLYIHSEPRTETVKADESGNWTLTITGIEEGQHTVEAEVINTDGTTSERKQIAAFTYDPTAATVATKKVAEAESGRNLLVSLVMLLIIALPIAGAGYWFWWRPRHKRPTPPTPQTPNDPVQPGDGSL